MEVPRIRSDATAASPLRRVGAEAARPDGSGSAPRDGAPRAGTSAQQPSAPRLRVRIGRWICSGASWPSCRRGAGWRRAGPRDPPAPRGCRGWGGPRGWRRLAPSAALREILSRLVRPGGGAADLRARVRAAAGDPTALLGALQSGSAEAEGPALARLAAALLPGNPVPGSAVPGDALEALAAALARVGRAAPVQAGGAWSAWIQGLAEALASALGSSEPGLRRALERGGLAGREAHAQRAHRESGALIGRAARPPGQRADGCRGTRTLAASCRSCRRARRGASCAPRTRGRSTARPRAPGGGGRAADQPSLRTGSGSRSCTCSCVPIATALRPTPRTPRPRDGGSGWGSTSRHSVHSGSTCPGVRSVWCSRSRAVWLRPERVRAAEGLLSDSWRPRGMDLVLSRRCGGPRSLGGEPPHPLPRGPDGPGRMREPREQGERPVRRAVALRYERGEAGAPRVVAKGPTTWPSASSPLPRSTASRSSPIRTWSSF